MKKVYVQPLAEAIQMKTVQMIAASGEVNASTEPTFSDWDDSPVVEDDDD